MTAKPVRITDTTFRDAHQSLMATRMRTEDMLPIAEKMDEVGFFSLEAWGGATFDVCIRYLNESPWDRVRQLKKKIRKTPLQMLLRGQNLVGYRHYADDLVVKFVEKATEIGIDIFRVFDALNDIRNMELALKTIKRLKVHAQGAISYTTSPVHTVERYTAMAKELATLECDSICIKDMSGIISPKIAFDLVRSIKKAVNLPVHLHTHSTSGMAPMAYLMACEAGVDIIDTAFEPFAWGTSQPPVESIVSSLRGTPYDPRLDLERLVEIGKYFRTIRGKYASQIDPISERVDAEVLVHQIPGGMVSNLIFQLKEQNAMEKLPDVLAETPKVREDLGYPPLVTPTSQIVGTQAVMNVLSGERYKLVSREVKDYVKGLYGKHPAPIRDEILKKIVGDEPIIACRPADLLKPEMDTMPPEAKKVVKSDEDLLTYALFPHVALKFFQGQADTQKPALDDEKITAITAAVASFAAQPEFSSSTRREPIGSRKSVWALAGRMERMRGDRGLSEPSS